ncbi:PqqD family protein [Prevotella fusca]|uniref:PqqD family protein n=1 Tax=Prevotella fusca TaxID=589436 RepID=UPI003F9FA372
MKVKNGFNLREVCGEHIIVAEGDENIDFSNIISMNESSAYLWEEVQKMDSFTVDNLVELICKQYEIDENTAREDAKTLAVQWGVAGIIEGEDIPEENSTTEKEIITEETSSTQTEAFGTTSSTQTESFTTEEKPKKKCFFKRLFG